MHSQESWGRVLLQEGLRGWVPSLLQDKGLCLVPSGLCLVPSPLSTHALHQGSR